MKDKYILAIDQGTTSSRAIVFDKGGQIIADAQEEFKQYYPANGWVEHDPKDIWSTTLRTAQTAFKKAENRGGEVIAIGITNQRETTLVWERDSLNTIYPAIVWQDRRTADMCQKLKEAGKENEVQSRTGLLLDPYFSASKVAWILDNVEDARTRAEQGELAFGTVDSYLVARLTGGKTHITDATNASRTLLYNIKQNQWDNWLLDLFSIPEELLPEVKDSSAHFGETDKALFGRALPICGIAGDQQAALFGQACFQPGDTKSTYGTGCFALMNIGREPLISQHRLLTTVAYRLGGETFYAMEGAIFIAGAAVQWLRDELQIIQHAEETEALAASLDNNNGVYLVPAFTGMGAPHWRADARGALTGLTRGSGRAHIVRAALEAVCYQTYDLLQAMSADSLKPERLRVDGGMVANNWLMQFLADTLALDIDRPKITETTALGAAYLAGLYVGLFDSLDDIVANWHSDRRFTPQQPDQFRTKNLQGWKKAVASVIN